LPIEEADDYIAAMRAANLCTVFLIAPTSSNERQEAIAKACTGFVYYVSRTGVTGEQASVETAVHGMVDRIKAVTPVPVAVGFGISKPEHASEVAAYADGVVVGSHIVRKIGELGKGPDTARAIVEFVKPLIDATKSAARTAAG
jgi:tryptophan synthase alpha chain